MSVSNLLIRVLSTVQVTKSAEKVTNTGERREGEESLTITDIQRSVHSSE